MTAIRTTVFKGNKTQAIRLPKPVALPDTIKNRPAQVREAFKQHEGQIPE